jgi:DNA polymerase III delta prime subunit
MKCRFFKDNASPSEQKRECLLTDSQKEFLKEIRKILKDSKTIPKSGNLILYGPPGMGRYFLLECLEHYLKNNCIPSQDEKAPEEKSENFHATLISLPAIFNSTDALVILLSHLSDYLLDVIGDCLLEDMNITIDKKISISKGVIDVLKKNESNNGISFIKVWESKNDANIGIDDIIDNFISENEDIFKNIDKREKLTNLMKSISRLFYILLRCEATLNYTINYGENKSEERGINGNLKLPFISTIGNLIPKIGNLSVGGDWKRKLLRVEMKSVSVSLSPFTPSQAVYYIDQVCRLFSDYTELTGKKFVIILGSERLSSNVLEELLYAIGSAVRYSNSVSFVISVDAEFYLHSKQKETFFDKNPLHMISHISLPFPILSISEIAKVVEYLEKEEENEADNKSKFYAAALFSEGRISVARNLLNQTILRKFLERPKENSEREKQMETNYLEYFKSFNRAENLFIETILTRSRSEKGVNPYVKDSNFYMARLFFYRVLRLLFNEPFSAKVKDIVKDKSLRRLAQLLKVDIYYALFFLVLSSENLIRFEREGTIKLYPYHEIHSARRRSK